MSNNTKSKGSNKRAASASPGGSTTKKKANKKTRKLPATFLDSASLDFVVGPPPERQLFTTPVASDVMKEVFLDRLVKEIVTPFWQRPKRKKEAPSIEYQHIIKDGKLVKQARPSSTPKENNHDSTVTKSEDKVPNRKWKERIVMGTNQCSRLLECLDNDKDATSPPAALPSLIVLARDVYPPTMLAHVPQVAQKMQIPLLLLPGQASLELGKALQMRRTTILMFLESFSRTEHAKFDSKHDKEQEMDPIDSFVAFIQDQIPTQQA